MLGSVASIYRYPVKSMAGESLGEAEIDRGGVVGDRRWALRDDESGKLVSAKRPRQWGAILDCRSWYEGGVVLTELPNGDQFEVPDPASAQALSGLFGRPVSWEEFVDPSQGSYESDWPEIEGMVLSGEERVEFDTNIETNEYGVHTEGFVDVSPIHLTTTSSMSTLREEDPTLVVDDRRFRPTLVVDTGELGGFPENDWSGREVGIGGVTLAVSGPTIRCVMATAAQGDLPRQLGILKTLAQINGIENVKLHTGAQGKGAFFGVWAGVSKPGRIRVGDDLTLEGQTYG